MIFVFVYVLVIVGFCLVLIVLIEEVFGLIFISFIIFIWYGGIFVDVFFIVFFFVFRIIEVCEIFFII